MLPSPVRTLLPLALTFSTALTGLAGATDTTPRKLTFSQLARTPITTETTTWPPEILALADREVRLTGYLLPLATEGGRTREFLLMRNQNTCCYGKAAVPTEFVVVHAPAPGFAVTMDVPVTVRGTLRLAPSGPAEAPMQLFRIDDATQP